jgi:hypothetical protein
MPSLDELKSAFIAADQVGNTDDASAFARAIEAHPDRQRSLPITQITPGSEEARNGLIQGAKDTRQMALVMARPWVPLALAAAGGTAIGGPGPGTLAGMGVYGAAHMADLPIMGVNKLGDLFGVNPNIPYPGASFDNVVNKYVNPLPEPSNDAERYAAAASSGIKDAVAGNRMGAMIKGASAAGGLMSKFGGAMAEAPGANAVLGAASSVGGEFGGEDGSTSGRVLGSLAPVLAATTARAGARGIVNAAGGPSVMKAYGRGFMGNGQDVVMANGEVLPASGGFGGARLEAARQIAENKAQQQIQALAGTDEARQAAAKNISMADAFTGDGFQPTSGSLSQNPGLTMAENALFQKDPIMRARYEANNRAVSGSVNDTLQPKGAPIPESQGGFLISWAIKPAPRSAMRRRLKTLICSAQTILSLKRKLP